MSSADLTDPASTDSDQADDDDRPHRGRSAWRFLRDILLILLAAILISFLIKTFLIRSFYIPSASMENTLLINDRIIVNELEPKLMPIQRGDVIVFTEPDNWLGDLPPAPTPSTLDQVLGFVGLAAPDSNDHLVKRVIGLPGDHVACCTADGKITVNGVPITEPYLLLPAGVTVASGSKFDVTVPKGELWVMGDNRNNSADSRAHQTGALKGFVPESDVVGRAIVITWPIDRWTVLGDYPTVFARVPNP